MSDQENQKIEGIIGGDAWLETGPDWARIAIFDEDGEELFLLPRDWTPAQINEAIRIYKRAFKAGESWGETRARAAVRAALGIP